MLKNKQKNTRLKKPKWPINKLYLISLVIKNMQIRATIEPDIPSRLLKVKSHKEQLLARMQSKNSYAAVEIQTSTTTLGKQFG